MVCIAHRPFIVCGVFLSEFCNMSLLNAKIRKWDTLNLRKRRLQGYKYAKWDRANMSGATLCGVCMWPAHCELHLLGFLTVWPGLHSSAGEFNVSDLSIACASSLSVPSS